MVREELRVLVLAANDLREDGGLNAMSVYSLLWIDPAMKQSTQVRCEGGRYPVWNEELVFSLGEDVLLFPHSTITIKVVSARVSEDSRTSSLLGTAYLPLAVIARMKAMKENPEDHVLVKLQLTTPSGYVQGSINLSVSLIDRRQRLSNILALLQSDQSIQRPVMGYPLGLPELTPYEIHQVSASDMEAYVASNFQPYLSSGYWNSDSSPCVHQTSSRQQHQKNIALALIGGAVTGFIIGDILGVMFR